MCGLNQEWSQLKIGNESYMFSATKNDDGFKVLVTNLVELWIEILTRDTILQRCQELNPLLNVDRLDCTELVTNILNNILDYMVEGATVEKIQLQSKIERGTVKFALNLKKASSKEFWDNITKPLWRSSMVLLKQHEILLDIIKRKDEEIAEYKAEGAELIRKNIETKPFDEMELKAVTPSLCTTDYSSSWMTLTRFYSALEFPDESVSTSPMRSPGIEGTKVIAEATVQNTLKSTSQMQKKRNKTRASTKMLSTDARHLNVVKKQPKRGKKRLNEFVL